MFFILGYSLYHHIGYMGCLVTLRIGGSIEAGNSAFNWWHLWYWDIFLAVNTGTTKTWSLDCDTGTPNFNFTPSLPLFCVWLCYKCLNVSVSPVKGELATYCYLSQSDHRGALSPNMIFEIHVSVMIPYISVMNLQFLEE